MTDARKNDRDATPGLLDQVITILLFLALGWWLLHLFVTVLEPDEREPRQTFVADYSEDALNEALERGGYSSHLEAIRATGAALENDRRVGRFTGGPGFYRAEQLILERFRAAGLEVRTQEFRVPVPVTEYCEILDESGKPLEGISIHPMMPAGLMPLVLPPEGITAQLLATDNMRLTQLDGLDPEKTIVATFPGSEGWPALASAGVKALVLQEDELAARLRADHNSRGIWESIETMVESSFPVFYATGPLRDFSGETITIRCKVVFESRPVRNLVGVLRGREKNSEAVVVTTFYDSCGIVPDHAPGAEQALSIASMLQLVEALAPYRGQLKRDVVFAATAAHGQAYAGVLKIMEALSKYQDDAAFGARADSTRSEHEEGLQHADSAQTFLGHVAGGDFSASWDTMPEAGKRWFEERWKVVAGEVNLILREAVLQARLAYLRAGSPAFREGFDAMAAGEAELKDPANQHPLLTDYIEAKQLDDRSGGFIGLPLSELATRSEFTEWRYLERMRRYLERLSDHHARGLRELEDALAIRELFSRYARTLTLNLALYSGGQDGENSLAVFVGIGNIGTVVEPQVSDLARALAEAVPHAEDGPIFDVVQWGPRDAQGNPPESPNPHGLHGAHESVIWHHAGYQAFTLISREFLPQKLGTPEDDFKSIDGSVVEIHTAALAKALLALGFGRMSLKTIDPGRKGQMQTVHGSVYGHVGSATLVPSHPLTERTFLTSYRKPYRDHKASGTWWSVIKKRGINVFPMMETDPYGRYRRLTTIFPFWSAAHVDVARFDEAGRVRYFKDASQQGQSVFKNMEVLSSTFRLGKGSPPKPIHVAVFRAEPVAFYDHINPQTLKEYKRVGIITQQGMTEPQRIRANRFVTFLEPDERFYLRLQDGAAGNEEIEETRAFMLNADAARGVEDGDPEILGRGYLAADTPLIRAPAFDIATSMLQTAEKRLALQLRYHMADPQMLEFQERAQQWLRTARERLARHDVQGAMNAAGTSVAYAINNHPVIRERISHAVLGIMWYLALLVPFVLFFEKLVFGFTDIRKQLASSGLIFLVFFGLLRFFHPAFQIVRSSLMILLGFIMLLLTLLVTAMVSGKFKQNMKELRGKEGQVEGADVNRSGVVGSALALGLNNMRRRKVRTGLTCATLVFITFAMICFTSVSNSLMDTEYVTGRSNWNGITIRKEYFAPLEGQERNSINQMYEDRFPTRMTRWYMTEISDCVLNSGFKNLEIPVERETEIDGKTYASRVSAEAGLILDWNEPDFSDIDEMMISERTWFPREPKTRAEKLEAFEKDYKARPLAILPDTLARELEITPEDVQGEGAEVKIGTTTFHVIGIIDSEKLNRAQGLDGKSILPVDLNQLQALGSKKSASGEVIVAIPDDAARIDASRVLILNWAPEGVAMASSRVISMSILFPRESYQLRADLPEQEGLGYKEQRRVVLEYLERTGQPAYYAIDGLSYFGQRKRARTLGGLLELIVPLLIAALTVFNTMRGSVYERREEIYVYNAVGIAPNHIFFMFMAEAAVYAVIGAMMGYILSQGMGRLLTAIGLTGGLNLDYSSIETIWASLAIIAAVLLSTILPARDAARLASPSGVSSWAMPEKDGDVMSFDLPFTFTPHDRLAVVSYFSRWLDANGEGSSGPFFCAPPEARVRENGDLLPVVSSTVWLKPYDLGVSQRMEISLPMDDETGEYVAHVELTRISGNQESWDRTVKPFLGVVRKQFLNWRATTDAEREEMFKEARVILGASGADDVAEAQDGEQG